MKRYLRLYKPNGDFFGEVLADNISLNLSLENHSTIDFTIPAKINGENNLNIYEIKEKYEVEIDLGNQSYRFIINSIPVESGEGVIQYSFSGQSLDAELLEKRVVSWGGARREQYYRKAKRNTTLVDNHYSETIVAGLDGTEPELIHIVEVRESGDKAIGPYNNIIKESSLAYFEDGLDDPLWGRGAFTVKDNQIIIANYSKEDYDKSHAADINIYYKIYDNPEQAPLEVIYEGMTEEFVLSGMRDNAVDTGRTTTIKGNTYYIEEYYTQHLVTLEEVLSFLFENTEWSYTISPELKTLRRTVDINNINKHEILSMLEEAYDAVFVVHPSKRVIHFFENYYDSNKSANVMYIDQKTYLKSFNYEQNYDNMFSNIIGLGKERLSFANINIDKTNGWENYHYFLDEVQVTPQLTNIDTASSIDELRFNTGNQYITSGIRTNNQQVMSRWMRPQLAEKVALWHYTRDYFYKILMAEVPYDREDALHQKYHGLYLERQQALEKLATLESRYVEQMAEAEANRRLKEASQKRNEKDMYSKYHKKETIHKHNAADILQGIEKVRDDIYNDKKPNTIASKIKHIQDNYGKYSAGRAWSFTEKELRELDKFRKDTVFQEETIESSVELLRAVKNDSEEMQNPEINLQVDVIDLFAANEVPQEDASNILLGSKIYLNLPEIGVSEKAQVKTMTYNIDDNQITLEISTAPKNRKIREKAILHQIYKDTVDRINTTKYNHGFIEEAIDISRDVVRIQNHGFDATKTEISAGEEDSITINEAGIETHSLEINHALEAFVPADSKNRISLTSEGIVVENYPSDPNAVDLGTRVSISTQDGFVIEKVINFDEDNFRKFERVLYADSSGDMFLKGTIEADRGNIGNWKINQSGLTYRSMSGGNEGPTYIQTYEVAPNYGFTSSTRVIEQNYDDTSMVGIRTQKEPNAASIYHYKAIEPHNTTEKSIKPILLSSVEHGVFMEQARMGAFYTAAEAIQTPEQLKEEANQIVDLGSVHIGSNDISVQIPANNPDAPAFLRSLKINEQSNRTDYSELSYSGLVVGTTDRNVLATGNLPLHRYEYATPSVAKIDFIPLAQSDNTYHQWEGNLLMILHGGSGIGIKNLEFFGEFQWTGEKIVEVPIGFDDIYGGESEILASHVSASIANHIQENASGVHVVYSSLKHNPLSNELILRLHTDYTGIGSRDEEYVITCKGSVSLVTHRGELIRNYSRQVILEELPFHKHPRYSFIDAASKGQLDEISDLNGNKLPYTKQEIKEMGEGLINYGRYFKAVESIKI